MNSSPFWLNQPSILLNHRHLGEVYPLSSMSLESKINALTRLTILVTLISFGLLGLTKVLAIGLCMLALLAGYYLVQKQQKRLEHFTKHSDQTRSLEREAKREARKEARTIGELNQLEDTLGLSHEDKKDMIHIHSDRELDKVLDKEFHPTDKRNPFGNVLLTDIGDHPDRRAARPSFNPKVANDIDAAVRKQTQMLNPTIQGTTKYLYGDLKDQFDLDRSMQRFYTTANSKITNDQGAFANFLFGSMYSSKEATPEGAMMRVKNSTYNYILI